MSSSLVEEGELSESSGEFALPLVKQKDQASDNSNLHPSETSRVASALARKRWFGCSFQSDFEILDKRFREVYKAKQLKSGKTVALKKILSRAEQEGFPITALREIKLLKGLRHPNVVEILDMVVDEEENESIYMVFPYMDHDLTGLLATEDIRFSTPQIKCYAKQLLEGIRYLHSRGVLHRDVKELRITDFGLARPLEENRKHYTPGVVTRWYRPPELLFGSTEYDQSVDMWGIGCILAEMHLKRPLFPGESDLNQLELISKLCGSPSLENFPQGERLPDFSKIRLASHRRRLLEEFTKLMDPLAADLIDKLLVLNPSQRLTAGQALQHVYFSSPPAAALPQSLPSYPSSHEYDQQKDKRMRAPHPTPHEHALNSSTRSPMPPPRRDYSRSRDLSPRPRYHGTSNRSKSPERSVDQSQSRHRRGHGQSISRSRSRSRSCSRSYDQDRRHRDVETRKEHRHELRYDYDRKSPRKSELNSRKMPWSQGAELDSKYSSYGSGSINKTLGPARKNSPQGDDFTRRSPQQTDSAREDNVYGNQDRKQHSLEHGRDNVEHHSHHIRHDYYQSSSKSHHHHQDHHRSKRDYSDLSHHKNERHKDAHDGRREKDDDRQREARHYKATATREHQDRK